MLKRLISMAIKNTLEFELQSVSGRFEFEHEKSTPKLLPARPLVMVVWGVLWVKIQAKPVYFTILLN